MGNILSCCYDDNTSSSTKYQTITDHEQTKLIDDINTYNSTNSNQSNNYYHSQLIRGSSNSFHGGNSLNGSYHGLNSQANGSNGNSLSKQSSGNSGKYPAGAASSRSNTPNTEHHHDNISNKQQNGSKGASLTSSASIPIGNQPSPTSDDGFGGEIEKSNRSKASGHSRNSSGDMLSNISTHSNDVRNILTKHSVVTPMNNPFPFALNKGTFSMHYELREEMGVGSTSKCYRSIRKIDNKEFACKVIDKRQVEMKFSGLLDQFYVEIKVLQTLNHPNIIKLEDTFESNERIYMIMEVMKGGELFDYVVEKGTLSEEEASILVRKITSAVAQMHAMNIIHRDLKPGMSLFMVSFVFILPFSSFLRFFLTLFSLTTFCLSCLDLLLSFSQKISCSLIKDQMLK
jgi:hypothetical protein